MTSALAILTYNRVGALKTELEGLFQHCGQYPLAIFEDFGWRDGTEAFLRTGSTKVTDRKDLLAEEWKNPKFTAFLGTKNLGVAGNSNRVIKWFLDETTADHLFMINDDLHILGDAVAWYAQAHEDLGVGLFCFCDFLEKSYKWLTIRSRGYHVKLLPRMTGILMSQTRAATKKVGYYDTRFGKFGEEHSDYTNRMRLAGQITLDTSHQPCLDIEHYRVGEKPRMLMKHQDVPTSVVGMERRRADAAAASAMSEAVVSYRNRNVFRPFALWTPKWVGMSKDVGIPVNRLLSSHALVFDHGSCN
jgi:hypothetical protein